MTFYKCEDAGIIWPGFFLLYLLSVNLVLKQRTAKLFSPSHCLLMLDYRSSLPAALLPSSFDPECQSQKDHFIILIRSCHSSAQSPPLVPISFRIRTDSGLNSCIIQLVPSSHLCSLCLTVLFQPYWPFAHSQLSTSTFRPQYIFALFSVKKTLLSVVYMIYSLSSVTSTFHTLLVTLPSVQLFFLALAHEIYYKCICFHVYCMFPTQEYAFCMSRNLGWHPAECIPNAENNVGHLVLAARMFAEVKK